MSKTYRFVLIGLLTWLFVAPVLFACTPPPVEGIAESWPPLAKVLITYDSNLNEVIGNAPAPMTTAVNNWNASTQLMCYGPVFSFTFGSGPTMSFAYGPIANNPNGSPRRGLTQLHFITRLESATSTINSNIPITFPSVLTETIAHEIGHTMGLFDCNYANGCPISSSVMVTQAPVATWTATQDTPGPTVCDVTEVEVNAPDYLCPTGTGPGSNCLTHVCGPGSPIILDLSGKGFDLTSAANGVTFDISGDGTPIQMGWTAQGADNAFLALPGADGLVHNGKELFGNFTLQPPSDHPNGFAALAVYDQPANGGNGDGVIDARDGIFASLRLWIDANHDGICQPEELHTLPSLGVNSLSLQYKEAEKKDQFGNVFRYRALVDPDNPSAMPVGRTAYDVFFVTLTSAPTAKNSLAQPGQKCAVPVPSKGGMLSSGSK
jgi:hypothetical protein